MAPYVIGITGASGVIYACRLLEILLKMEQEVSVVISPPGLQVLQTELQWELGQDSAEIERNLKHNFGLADTDQRLKYFSFTDVGAKIASGSFKTKGMIVIPCTMSTLSGIAHGSSRNLLERAADIALKEKRPLILVPRETPLNQIHLQNMLTLSQIGVHIVPPMPAFYHHPKTIDDLVNFVVGRILDLLEIEHELFPRWQG